MQEKLKQLAHDIILCPSQDKERRSRIVNKMKMVVDDYPDINADLKKCLLDCIERIPTMTNWEHNGRNIAQSLHGWIQLIALRGEI